MAEKIQIALCGCDDTTIFEIEVTEAERALIERMCKASKDASDYGCMPTMEIRPC